MVSTVGVHAEEDVYGIVRPQKAGCVCCTRLATVVRARHMFQL